MKIDIKKITSAISKIADLTSGDKIIPGVLFKPIYDNDTSKLQICYSDGHKSLIEEISVVPEEGDRTEPFAVEFEPVYRAIRNCQPSGIMMVDTVTFTFNNEPSKQLMTVSAVPYTEITDENGSVVDTRVLAVKKIDIAWAVPEANMKTSILSRMKYNDIFECDSMADEYNKSELISALVSTSVEKGKSIYVSAKVQAIFVANQAHVTCVPISGYEMPSQEEQDEIRGTLSEAGTYSEENLKKAIADKVSRIHHSAVILQSTAKAIASILGKTTSETVSAHRKDKYFNIFIDNEDEKVGIWFEMAQASKAHIGSLERYSSLEYKTYQTLYIKEVLSNAIKSALESAKNDKTIIRFVPTELTNTATGIDLEIASSNIGASVSDVYKVNLDELVDPTSDIETKQFNISLRVFADMLAQLKTTYVALDFDTTNGTTCIRLAEVDDAKLDKAYADAREKTKQLVESQGQTFDANTTPTNIQFKLDYRSDIIKTKQFTILSK